MKQKHCMTKKLFLTHILILIVAFSFAQSLDSLMLTDSELPAGYSKSDKILCVTPHGYSFYSTTDAYESMIGKVIQKQFQSFEKKGDKGSILYFEFEKEFDKQNFLEPLLWGEKTKPTKSEPEEYYSKGRFLVIWSFNLKSELKEVSKVKVMRLLQ